MPDQNDIVFIPSFQLDVEGILSRLYILFTGYGGGIDGAREVVANWWYLFSIISFIFSALLLVGITYAMIRYSELRTREEARLREQERAFRLAQAAAGENARWQSVTAHISSDNPNDWRVAIVEADIMLDELLDSLGYAGATIADKLKAARPEAFRSIEDAWEAHKVRNAVAHRGGDFVLTRRATDTAIAQYRQVFEEFKFI